MEKFYEKKNLGVPVTIPIVLAYLIGYSLTRSLSGTLLVAVLFGGAVFSLQFDDGVKNAVKHAYIFAAIVQLIYFAFNIFESFISIFLNGRAPSMSSFQDGFYGFGFIPRLLTFLYTYGLILVNIAVVVIFGLFIVMTLFRKDIKIRIVARILGETPAKPKKQQPTYNQNNVPPMPYGQQPAQPYAQPPVNQQQPVTQQPAQPYTQPPVSQQPPVTQQPAQPYVQAPVSQQPPVTQPKLDRVCTNCGTLNKSEAKFCVSCGSNLK